MASQIVTSGANFVTAIIIVRVLGLEAFGLFSICFLLIMVVRNFLNGCVLVPMSSIGPKLRPTTLPAYRGFATAGALAFAVLSSALLVAAATPLSAVLNSPALLGLAAAMSLANVTAVLADYVRRHHFVYEAPARAFAVDLARFGIQLGVLLWLATSAVAAFSAETSLYAMAAGSLCGVLVGCPGFGSIRWSRRLATALWPRHWAFIKWMTPATALEAVQGRAPIFIAGAVLGEAALGLVRALQQVANILNLPFNALQQVALSMAARAVARGGDPALKQLLVRMTGVSVMLLIVGSAIVVLAGDFLAGAIFQIDNQDVQILLALFCVLNIMVLLRLPLSVICQVREIPSFIATSNVVGCLISLSLAWLLIPLIGPTAVPLVSIVVVFSTILVFAIQFLTHRPGKGAWKAIGNVKSP